MAGFGLLRGLASREPASRWLYALVQLAKWVLCGFCFISAPKEPIQPYNLVSGLHSVYHLPTFLPRLPTLVSTRDTSSARATGQIFYLIWWETLKAAKNS